MNAEIIGMMANFVLLFSYMVSGEFRIRVIGTIGNVILTVYGILIQSPTVIFLNSILVVINIYKIRKLRREKRNEQHNEISN